MKILITVTERQLKKLNRDMNRLQINRSELIRRIIDHYYDHDDKNEIVTIIEEDEY
jgi:metal-responsive CopG/Arc/MetJ family transcriptional regulator